MVELDNKAHNQRRLARRTAVILFITAGLVYAGFMLLAVSR